MVMHKISIPESNCSLLGWKKNAHHEEDGDVPLAKYIGKTNIGLKTKKRTERLGQGISRSID